MKYHLSDTSISAEIIESVLPHDTVFIHGNVASNLWWEPARQLLEQRAKGRRLPGRMILIEWRGCGESLPPRDESELKMSNLAHDCVRVLRMMGIGHASIVGHSTGGLIALLAMAQAPELFGRAAVLNSIGAHGAVFTSEKRAALETLRDDRDKCAWAMSRTIHNVDIKSEFFSRVVDTAMSTARINWLGVPNALTEIDHSFEFRRIHQPVLVLHGELDPLLSAENSQQIARDLSNGTYVEIKDHGHSLNVEAPERFISLIEEFLFPYRPAVKEMFA